MQRLSAIALFLLLAVPMKADDVKTIDDRVTEFGEIVRQRLVPNFEAAGVSYPPARIALLGFKTERVIEVYAADTNGNTRFICEYPLLAASGRLGPKLREGDRQVPEGIYRVRELNPNSRFHLSLWLSYPNDFDLAHAVEEGRNQPGGEIMIHGDDVSSGCLAVGDEAAEDLFVLAALTGIDNVTVILAPVDFRQRSLPNLSETIPDWSRELYDDLKCELALYRRE